jgi:hypothetical protein
MEYRLVIRQIVGVEERLLGKRQKHGARKDQRQRAGIGRRRD